MAALDAIKAIQTALRNVTGVAKAPDYPGSGEDPIVLTHLDSGEITPDNPAGARTELHNIMCELHVAEGGDLAAAFTTLETLHPLVVAALVADITFGGTLLLYASISYSTQRTSWYGAPTLARTYVLNGAKIIV